MGIRQGSKTLVHSLKRSSTRRELTSLSLSEELLRSISVEEINYISSAPCPVLAVANRITRAVTTRGRVKRWTAPAPIISRIYQELSTGMLAYNNCMKSKEIPVPFAYVQAATYSK
jgi:hypothetical protein